MSAALDRHRRGLQQRWIRLSEVMDPLDRTTVSNAMRVAADQYEADAATCNESPRLALRFREQCEECRAIADAVEL